MRKLALLSVAILFLGGCASTFEDELLPPTDQEIQEAKLMLPSGALQRGVFHMQRIRTSSPVRVDENIQLKRPDLPAFDVAYLNRNLESVVLELANAAGESVVVPRGLRSHSITLVHSGANFKQMLDLVLSKAGYSYNYVDGVWKVTRYPTRSYLLEVGQSERRGSIIADTEVTNDEDSLSTDYNDQIWDQVQDTLQQLVNIGMTTVEGTGSGGNTGITEQSANLLPDTSELQGQSLAADENLEGLLATLTPDGNIRPLEIATPTGSAHLGTADNAEPWYRVTRSVGMITVRAAPEAHRMIEDYLEQVQESAHRQIMVEARIVAVIRDLQTDRGVDFDRTGLSIGDTLLASIGFEANNQVTSTDLTGGFISLASAQSNDITFIMQMLNAVGDVYTISSPTLIARNNQISRVSITRELGYAETQVETSTNAAGDVVVGNRIDTAQFKNAGTVLSVFPYIGKSRVQMRVRLSVASRVGDVTIQTSIGTDDPVTNTVPELSSNVIDQDIVLEYGRVYAIGGLIETSTDFDHSYIPGLADVPGLGEVFQRARSQKLDTEFIVMMKVSRT